MVTPVRRDRSHYGYRRRYCAFFVVFRLSYSQP
jgi:hypothetical protein